MRKGICWKCGAKFVPSKVTGESCPVSAFHETEYQKRKRKERLENGKFGIGDVFMDGPVMIVLGKRRAK